MRNRLWLAPLLWTIAGCTCGTKEGTAPVAGPDFTSLLKELPRATVSRPSALVPKQLLGEGAVLAATSDAKGTWDAFLQTDLGKALVKGGAIDHLKLSAQLEA